MYQYTTPSTDLWGSVMEAIEDMMSPEEVEVKPLTSMDYQVLVQEKLTAGDHCLCCIMGVLVEEGHKQDRVIALIEGQGEFGLFLYCHGQASTQKAADLKVDAAFPITPDFKFNIVAPLGTPETDGTVPVRMSYSSYTFLLELPKKEEAGIFLQEVKRCISVQSQNAGFGLSSSFSWMEKYLRAPTSDETNPFLEDILDPNKSNKDGWPWNVIESKDVGETCPIVQDESTMERSPSLDFLDSYTATSGNSTVKTRSADLERTYGKSLDNLEESLREGKPVGGRETLIKLVMKQREDEYTDEQRYKIFCGTWNVNGQPASESCRAWLASDAEPPDIYAIGFQELDLSKNAYIFTDSVREEEWYRKVKEALHPKAKYKRVKLVRLVGIMMVVFVKMDVAHHIYDVLMDSVGTGIMGMMGNKGGVGVRFEFHDTSICFINTHLAAHVEEFERRNQDFRNINSRMKFEAPNSEGLSISDHDIVFWIGDLNYRLSDCSNEMAKELIKRQDWHTLMGFDQLCRQISMKRVFLDYVEGRISFVPTYKYDTGTDNFDSSEKCRVPAWCDRILWRGPSVKQEVYRSHPEQKLSDHKPVSAIFDTGVRVINREKYSKVYEDVMKALDRYENDFLPQVTLSRTEMQFDNVKFIGPQTQTITVTNTGQVPVEYKFINKPGEASFCKPWLNVEPSTTVIKIGEQCEVQFEVYIDKSTAMMFNSGMERLEDIVVLHLEGGKDLFISISGNYIISSFGASVETLIHIFPPIREVKEEDVVQLEKHGATHPLSTTPTEKDRPLDIPKEVWRLVNHLYRYGMDQEDLFQQPGLDSEIQMIRDCLDTGLPTTIPGGIHSVAESLLLFLEALAESVIPSSYYYKCLDCCSNFVLCKQVLQQIPVCHRTLFKYICAFLRKLLQHSTGNNLEIKILAQVFGGLLIRKPGRNSGSSGNLYTMMTSAERTQKQQEDRKRAAFIYHFLSNEYDE